MSHTWKISEAASIALHAMALLAINPDKQLSTKEIANQLKVSETHLAKVLQRLAKANLLKAIRGPKGGFICNKPTNKISLLDVYEAIEGPFSPANCLFGSPICGGERCLLGGLLNAVDKQVADYFATTKLSDLADVYLPKATDSAKDSLVSDSRLKKANKNR